MRCLVTGATGHIGSYLVKYLLKQNVEVAILMRPSTSNLWRIKEVISDIHVINGDLATINEAINIRDFAPDIIFHLAWYGVGNRFRDDPVQINLNLNGSLKLLELAHEAGCKQWIGLGSQAEYGTYNKILTEDMATQAKTTYGVTKLCTGLLTQKMCEIFGMGFTWLRLAAAYGPMDDQNHLIPQVILKLLQNKEPQLTPGEQRWDYLYVEDVVEALYKVSLNPETKGIFNLGSGESYTVRSIVERIRDLIDPNLPLVFGAIPYSPDQIMHLQVDISSLKKVTGWLPKVQLEEGLQRTVNWFIENQFNYR